MEDLIFPSTVLVVEDEFLVRMLAVDILCEQGFEVFEACDAADALNLLHREVKIDLLFTDVRMPGEMDGVELAQFARTRWPKLRVIITSGHCGAHPPLPDISYLSKPYATPQLLALVRSELARTEPASARA